MPFAKLGISYKQAISNVCTQKEIKYHKLKNMHQRHGKEEKIG